MFRVKMQHQYYIYILTNSTHRTLYTGVTNNLTRRVYEHKHGLQDGFTKKYHVNMLMYYEVFESIEYAINREKQIKNYSRKKKEELINSLNKEWRDLYPEIVLV
jgi:putative endonuclease